jgi:hypothetical protein
MIQSMSLVRVGMTMATGFGRGEPVMLEEGVCGEVCSFCLLCCCGQILIQILDDNDFYTLLARPGLPLARSRHLNSDDTREWC